MAKTRTLHNDQWTDVKFVRLSFAARLLALGVRNLADDNGIFIWDPLQIKIRLFPADAIDVEPLLDELIEHRQVKRYAVKGESYGIIRNFRKFQRLRWKTYTHPLPPQPLGPGYDDLEPAPFASDGDSGAASPSDDDPSRGSFPSSDGPTTSATPSEDPGRAATPPKSRRPLRRKPIYICGTYWRMPTRTYLFPS